MVHLITVTGSSFNFLQNEKLRQTSSHIIVKILLCSIVKTEKKSQSGSWIYQDSK